MKYDHDLHIHSQLSLCSNDPKQTKENILDYAIRHKLKYVCITDHFWDERLDCPSDWYKKQNFKHISQILPLPKHDDIIFGFGCETEMDKSFKLAITKERMEEVDFVIIPFTHLHMTNLTIDPVDNTTARRSSLYVHRFNALLNYELPENKVGIAHLTCPLIAGEDNEYVRVLDNIPDSVFNDLFLRTAEKKLGVELNLRLNKCTAEETESILRPYRIAKECGCKFYFGTDAHHPENFDEKAAELKRIAELLKLEESDKFIPSFIKK